jgi:GTP-binding protein
MFLDEAIITVRSGAGGDGCVSFRREKYIPRGGPDGGDGGHGGSVLLRACQGLSTLGDISRKPLWVAPDGSPGRGNNCRGRDGEDLTIDVPTGTLVRVVEPGRSPREGPLLGDLVKDRDELLAARGGRGGRGNKSFATATHQVPREREEGGAPEERSLYLELKLLADVGLVGLPNAGKSTLLSRVSAARPKIAAYPFTTLSPYLGLVETGEYRRFVFADIPGLIEGAHQGVGLGIDFLRHVERTRVLVHLVSVESLSLERMVEDYRAVEKELSCYARDLASKPRWVAASKVDLLEDHERERLTRELSRKLGVPVHPLSAVSGMGVQELVSGVMALLTSSAEWH